MNNTNNTFKTSPVREKINSCVLVQFHTQTPIEGTRIAHRESYENENMEKENLGLANLRNPVQDRE